MPWTLCIIAGRVTLDGAGNGHYKAKPKLEEATKWSFFRTGVNTNKSVAYTGRIMVLTRWGTRRAFVGGQCLLARSC